ncbi:hypothetical protein DIT71_17360 [Marinobacter vulgaris]|uniref:Uncharacterized protein n=1 Tax=Marinobacter vulgaris TaxID=1928331 RepID=A0A2V3ZU56_9GAMM|nr:hypothetical protein [Marinobacter vulgaris]PXX88376.1 hypothetical protein DIT71_17360 [Marinobacter vulgaris]TSJ66148.1 hypothetical protein FPC41_17460 [Marinobacter vulgaris]
MISFMIVRWGVPVFGGVMLYMVVGLCLGLFAPGVMSGIMGSINGFFDFIFSQVSYFIPHDMYIAKEEWITGSAETGGILRTHYTEFGRTYNEMHDWFTGLPTYGNALVGASIAFYFVFEIIVFTLLAISTVRRGGKVNLNQGTEMITPEATDGSWVMGGRKKK